MTIQEAIDVLNTRGEHGNLTGYAAWQTEALDMAVRSLEAWKEARRQIEKFRNYWDYYNPYSNENELTIARYESYDRSLDIIDKCIKGVTENENSN